jgi:ABC-type multidrug transport system ATPase subunit
VRDVEHRAAELLDAVALGHAARRPAGDYSGGMRRRLGIAQALIHRPSLIVVDEPTAGLDPEERIRFRNLIADAAEETAVLLSTHIVEDVEAICPRLAVIARGTLLFDGTPTQLFERTAADPAEAEPTLERAYGAFLARHAASVEPSREPAA